VEGKSGFQFDKPKWQNHVGVGIVGPFPTFIVTASVLSGNLKMREMASI
jgi:hypothetical protein